MTHKIIEQIILSTQEKLTADFNQDIYKHPRKLTSITFKRRKCERKCFSSSSSSSTPEKLDSNLKISFL